MTGWVFILAGVVLIGMGSLSIYYGQDLLRRGASLTPTAATTTPSLTILSPQQEGLLRIIHKYQVQFGAKKLIIGRKGELHFDEAERQDPARRDIKVNVATELLGSGSDPAARGREFEALMEGMPPEYLRMIPETRMDSPFVVAITDAGVRYLKER